MATVRDGFQDQEINDRIDRLLIVAAAMWELVQEHTELTDEDLITRAIEVDSRDGIVDGHCRLAALDCTCGAKINPSTHKCQFCGEAAPLRTIFDLV